MKPIFSLAALALIACSSLIARAPKDTFLGKERILPKGLESGPVEGIDTNGVAFEKYDDENKVAVLAVSRKREVTPVTLKFTGKKLAGRMLKRIKTDGEKTFVIRYMDKNGKILQVATAIDKEVVLTDVVHVIAAYIGVPGQEKGAISVSGPAIKAFYKEMLNLMEKIKKIIRKKEKSQLSRQKGERVEVIVLKDQKKIQTMINLKDQKDLLEVKKVLEEETINHQKKNLLMSLMMKKKQ